MFSHNFKILLSSNFRICSSRNIILLCSGVRGGLSDVKWDRCCFCFKCVMWEYFVRYFWCLMISNCRLLRRVCIQRWLEIVKVDWPWISSIWLCGASVRSIEGKQFEINTSRSLSVGLSFLSLSKSFSNLSTMRELVKSLCNRFKNGWFSFVQWYNPDMCQGWLFWRSIPAHLCSKALIEKVCCFRIWLKYKLNRFMIKKFWY